MKGAFWLLSRVLPAGDRDAIVGDLLEEQQLRSRAGAHNEWLWIWRQALRSLAPLAWTIFLRGNWIATVAAGLAAYGLVKIQESTTSLLWPLLPEALAANPVLIGLVGFSTMLLGGVVATWMRRGAALPLAVVSTLMVSKWIMTDGANVPLPWQLYFLISCPVAALSGAKLWQARAA
jgi:hypothetical protein